ncbi:MAG: hypothetical protein RLZ04_1772 [Actinomycetota bacterium]|jgi:inosose dehydratase
MLDRIAAAPISWGICEAPGWGMQLDPRRVLGEMRELGITATELGALGWLPTEPTALRTMLDEYGMRMIGGFVPLIMHRADKADQLVAEARSAAETLVAGGGQHFVSALVSSHESWEHLEISSAEWATVFENLLIVDEIAAEHGLVQVVHPHVNTLLELDEEFQRFLDNSPVKFTLDTGHLYIGGANPVEIAEKHSDRVGLVHIKDVDMAVAGRMRAGELTLMTATQAGLFPAAGNGDVPIAATIAALETRGYPGWYVLEQDVALTDGEPPLGEGPVLGVRQSIEYLKSLAA